MNKNTEKLFFRSVDSLLDRYNPDHPDFKLQVWKRYKSLAAAQRFVSEMLEERYTRKHSEDRLATVTPMEKEHDDKHE